MSFFSGLPFQPDSFQIEAAEHIDAGRSVVVVAPTGAGKTLIAEYAVARAYQAGGRAFYTTPIKALSNQKFADFCGAYGDGAVGLLTGDNVINGDAPIVVMTTEVLRNMIYAESTALDDLAVVVLDEVHYLQNRYRGAIWEEVIIHLPVEIPLVCLSATIANAEEFTGWVSSRRGDTALVVETRRPVPLESMYLVKDRFHEGQMALLPVFGRDGKRPNPQVTKLLDKGRGRRRRFAAPRRMDVAELLAAEGLLPAIYFIFSRDGCDQAATRVAASGLGLTDGAARAAIRERIERLTEHLPARDLETLGYASWSERLERGVAAHHAGMVPAFKEAVEDLFAAGLLKLVFATETLSLGINMPARTVVLERLSKFTGEAHEVLQPGDYTQLTGRAGRRGIDAAGTAVVLHNFDIPFGRVAGIAAQGSHPLESSFEPTYNMVANLVANYSKEAAERLLNASFAQFRSQEHRARLEESLGDHERDLAEFRRRAECHRGDLWAYLDAGGGVEHQGAAMRDFVQRFRDGDVLRLGDDEQERGVILARGWGANPRFMLLEAQGEVRRVSAADLSPRVALIGQMILPEPVRSKDSGYRSSVARMLRDWEPDPRWEPDEFVTGDDPVAACPRLTDHLAWVRRAQRTAGEVKRLQRRLERTDAGLVPHFRRILRLLETWGYVRGWKLTRKGAQLRFVYNELDLLLTEAIDRGHLRGIDPAELAALISLFTFEARRADGGGDPPPGTIAERVAQIGDLAGDLAAAERQAGLAETRLPDAGFAAVAYAWAMGHDLEDLFEDDFAAGDFVRNCRQLIDLVRQVRDGFPELATVAAAAVRQVDRGVVAAGGRL